MAKAAWNDKGFGKSLTNPNIASRHRIRLLVLLYSPLEKIEVQAGE